MTAGMNDSSEVWQEGSRLGGLIGRTFGWRMVRIMVGAGSVTVQLLLYAVMGILGWWLVLATVENWGTSPWRAVASLCGLAGLLALLVDAFVIEPAWLEITRYRWEYPNVKRPLKIVVVADLQTDHIGAYERRALQRTMDERPDLIVMCGDYLQVHDILKWERLRDELRKVFSGVGLAAPLGVFAVRGNVDSPRWMEIFDEFPVTTFNESGTVKLDDLWITGLSLKDSFQRSVSLPSADRFHLVVGHAPNYALETTGGDLLLAGHTHGGQVRLPFIGPLLTLSLVPRSWASGVTELGGGRRLIVSRGIGMERRSAPRVRFCCRPELIVLELVPA